MVLWWCITNKVPDKDKTPNPDQSPGPFSNLLWGMFWFGGDDAARGPSIL